MLLPPRPWPQPKVGWVAAKCLSTVTATVQRPQVEDRAHMGGRGAGWGRLLWVITRCIQVALRRFKWTLLGDLIVLLLCGVFIGVDVGTGARVHVCVCISRCMHVFTLGGRHAGQPVGSRPTPSTHRQQSRRSSARTPATLRPRMPSPEPAAVEGAGAVAMAAVAAAGVG